MRLLITLTIALLFVSLKLSAQITTQKMFEPSNDLEETPYDSTLNFLGENVNQYIGELLYVKGMSESLRYYGYDGFVKDYREFVDNPSNVYECCDRYNSKYKKLVERYFLVLDVIPHPKANRSKSEDFDNGIDDDKEASVDFSDSVEDSQGGVEDLANDLANIQNLTQEELNDLTILMTEELYGEVEPDNLYDDLNEELYGDKYYLKLEAKDNGDIVYFEYDTRYEFSFPFIVSGYFVKTKENLVGNRYVLTNKNSFNWDEGLSDFKTAEQIDVNANLIWSAVDLTIEEEYFSLALVLVSNNGDSALFSYDLLDDIAFIMEESVAKQFRATFGDSNWDVILNGNIMLGMTDVMCRISWGEPDSINRTISESGVQEQWVYESNYLYFDNGILTTIQ